MNQGTSNGPRTAAATATTAGDLSALGGGGCVHAFFVNDVVAAAREDENGRQLGATKQSSNRYRRRVVETLSEHCDDRTLEALSEMVREVLGQRGAAVTGGRSKSTEAAQEKHAARSRLSPDTQYDNPMMQQQQQRQQRMAAAADSYDVFGTGAERTVLSSGGGKDTQYGNPMMQQQQQRQHRMAAAADSYDVFGTGAERAVPPGAGKDEAGAARTEGGGRMGSRMVSHASSNITELEIDMGEEDEQTVHVDANGAKYWCNVRTGETRWCDVENGKHGREGQEKDKEVVVKDMQYGNSMMQQQQQQARQEVKEAARSVAPSIELEL